MVLSICGAERQPVVTLAVFRSHCGGLARKERQRTYRRKGDSTGDFVCPVEKPIRPKEKDFKSFETRAK